MSNDEEVGGHEALLSAFSQQVPKGPERLPTLLEITRYPHYEDVCSNILEFYLDPKNPHGLGALFLKAIACIGKIEDQQGISANVKVTREKYTKTGKRIDILVESDTHAVLIENKIGARIDNPFCEYSKHLDSLQQPYKHKLLLTLKPDKRDVAQYCGFDNITHEQLVKKIRDLLGAHVANADTRYLTFMLDFLNTLDYLREGMVMNPEFVEFLSSRQREAEDFLEQIRAFKGELRATRITPLGRLIDVGDFRNVRQSKYREDYKVFDILVHEIEYSSDYKVAIDTQVNPRGWKIQIFPRESDSVKLAKLETLLQNLGVDCEPDEEQGDRRFLLKKRFDYAADLNELAEVVRDVVSKLAQE
jgi:hypothetical protein